MEGPLNEDQIQTLRQLIEDMQINGAPNEAERETLKV